MADSACQFLGLSLERMELCMQMYGFGSETLSPGSVVGFEVPKVGEIGVIGHCEGQLLAIVKGKWCSWKTVNIDSRCRF